MKMIFLVLAFGLFLLTSCNRHNESCPYDIYSDPALFVSYEINEKQFEYYQSIGSGFGSTMDYNYSSILSYTAHIIPFTNLKSGQDSINAPQTAFIINNSSIISKEDFFIFPYLSKVLKFDYPFMCPPHYPALKDTILMNGVGIEIKVTDQAATETYSTEQVIKHFNYNLDSITAFFSEGSYFHIDNIKPVCDALFLVTGSFETVLLDDVSENRISVRNGKFAFLTQ